MKKKIISLCLVFVLALAVIGGTLAYFTDTDSADNIFTVGDVDISLWEDGMTPEDYNEDEKLDDILPGQEVSKQVTIENHEEAAWVRVTVVVPVDMTATFGEEYEAAGWTLSQPYGENSNIFVFTGYLGKGETSPVLLNSVKLNEDITNEGDTSEYHVPVLVEAIQYVGFENDPEGAFAALTTANVKNYIDQYTTNDAFKALESGDIVTLAADTTLPQTLNDGVVLIGGAEDTTVGLYQAGDDTNSTSNTIITSNATLVNLHFTERVILIGDATFVDCTFDKGVWVTGVTGNVSFVHCNVTGTKSDVALLVDGAADGQNGGETAHGRVIVLSTEINGSASIAGATSALYEDCTFGPDNWSWKQIRINCPTTIEGCGAAEELSYANGSNWALRIIP